LSARPLRPNSAELDFGLQNGYQIGHAQPQSTVKLVLSCIHTAKESTMAKGQQKTNKEAKKPKKDTSPPKPLSAGEPPVRATITTAVIPRGKLKTK
jgi:hypothetical protein